MYTSDARREKEIRLFKQLKSNKTISLLTDTIRFWAVSLNGAT